MLLRWNYIIIFKQKNSVLTWRPWRSYCGIPKRWNFSPLEVKSSVILQNIPVVQELKTNMDALKNLFRRKRQLQIRKNTKYFLISIKMKQKANWKHTKMIGWPNTQFRLHNIHRKDKFSSQYVRAIHWVQ